MKKYAFLILFLAVLSCQKNNVTNIEKWKQEIVDTEKAFSDMAIADGIPAAFLAYSADNGVMMRNNQLIKGYGAMETYFQAANSNPNQFSLSWKPDFVDVANSGDLGYTYGEYTLTVTDSTGNAQESKGIFHTVWKRQADGSWKFVWD
ncbi:YybH family protein [Roseivirga sp.]|uniref:YybH family protein n=1 Tax=Roseivirga sp. TaxID=1964215 RepID=UPI003B51CBEA